MKQIILLFIMAFSLMLSCKSNKPLVQTKEVTVEKTIKEIIHDTVFKIKKDKSSYEALLKCQDEKVVIIKDTVYQGDNLEPPRVNITANKLTCDCYNEAQELFAQWKETYETETTTVEDRIPYEVEKKLSYWQKTQIKMGNFFMITLISLGGYFLFKLKKKLIKWMPFLKNTSP